MRLNNIRKKNVYEQLLASVCWEGVAKTSEHPQKGYYLPRVPSDLRGWPCAVYQPCFGETIKDTKSDLANLTAKSV